MSDNNLEVGSYVWFVRDDKPAVYHYLVVEEIVKKSISGTTRDYIFELSISGRRKRVESKSLSGQYFVEKDLAYKYMLDQAGIAIHEMMARVEQTKPDVRPVAQEATPVTVEEDETSDNSDTIIELPDGTKARLKGGIPK